MPIYVAAFKFPSCQLGKKKESKNLVLCLHMIYIHVKRYLPSYTSLSKGHCDGLNCPSTHAHTCACTYTLTHAQTSTHSHTNTPC